MNHEEPTLSAALRQELQEFTNRNAFIHTCGIEVRAMERDYAVMGITARPELLNPMGMLHGGLLYTLADCCCGVAARTDGRLYVTQNGSLNYIHNVSLGAVHAESRVLHRGRTVCTVDVRIYSDETATLLAAGMFTMFAMHPPRQENAPDNA